MYSEKKSLYNSKKVIIWYAKFCDFKVRIPSRNSGLSYGGRDYWSGTRNFRILGSDFRVGSPDYCMEVAITDLVREIS